MDIKPFSQSYVLDITLQHMRKSLYMSINKTWDRIPDFEDGSPKHREVMDTFNNLQLMRKMLDDFEANNQHILKGDDNA